METHKYRLVVFLNTKKTKEIDIVPATWLHYCNETSDTLLCKFMPPTYNKDKAKKLIEMVKNCDLPEEGWPNYPVDLVGRAHTYEDAEDKVIELENKPYAYSTDNESKAKSKALEDKKKFKFKSITKTSVCDELDQTIIDLNASMDTNQCLNESFSRQSAAEKPSDSSDDDCKKSTKKDKYARNKTSLGKKYKKKEKKSSTKLYEESDSSNIEMKDTESKVSKVRRKHVIKDIEISKKSSLQDKVYFSEGNNNYEDRICNTIREYYRSLSKKIANLQGEVIQMSLLVKELQQNLEELQKRNNVESFFNCEKDNDEDNQHSLPCQDYEQFEALDEKLSLDENFRQKIIRKIFSVINKKSTVTKNVGQILRMFLSQDLAMKFTTIKPVLGKHVFCSTKLYCCIQDVMIKLFTENDGTALTLPSFQQSVKAILNNAKDWCGQGSIRKKNTKK